MLDVVNLAYIAKVARGAVPLAEVMVKGALIVCNLAEATHNAAKIASNFDAGVVCAASRAEQEAEWVYESAVNYAVATVEAAEAAEAVANSWHER